MSDAVTLRDGGLEACVLPRFGGSLSEFSLHRAGRKLPLFRPLAAGDMEPPEPTRLACYPLIPWSNRIGQARFDFDGETYAVARTDARERYPIHGDGWLRSWRVAERAANAVKLEIASQIAPFAYSGSLEYALRDGAMEVRLSVRNTGPEALPFGLGLHPWFVRTPQVKLRARARGMLAVADDLLPIAHVAVPDDVDLTGNRTFPDRLVDNSFTGWDGSAEIVWDDTGVRLAITTEPRLDFFQLYAPPGRDYFCFEPITHPANAFNLPPPHTRAGLVALAPGEATAMTAVFRAG